MRATASRIRARPRATTSGFEAPATVMADTPASAATSFSVVPPVPRRGVRRAGLVTSVAGDAGRAEDEGTMPDVNANPMRTWHRAATAYSFLPKGAYELGNNEPVCLFIDFTHFRPLSAPKCKSHCKKA